MENYVIILTESKKGGHVVNAIVTPKLFEQLDRNQTKGGYKRYSIVVEDMTSKEPTSKDLHKIVVFNNIVLG